MSGGAQEARLRFLLCGLAGLLVLGGGVAGVVRAVVRTVAQSHGVLGAGGPAGGHLACLGGGVGGGGLLVQQGDSRLFQTPVGVVAMGAEEGPGGADVIPEPPPPEVLVTRTGSTLGMGLPSLVCSFTT